MNNNNNSDKDPFRPADVQIPCPKCGGMLYYNHEDLAAGVQCENCGYEIETSEEEEYY